MAVERGFVDFTVYRGDVENYNYDFYTAPDGVDPTDPNNQTPEDLATVYDEIVMDIRTRPSFESRRIERLTLTDGDFVISNTNNVAFNLENTHPEGLYYYDMRFKLLGTTNWQTLISGTVQMIDNVSDKDNLV